MGKDENIAIFEDTVNKVNSGLVVTNSVTTKHTFSDIIQPTGVVGELKVWGTDSVSLIDHLQGISDKLCILNMASRKKAGGGVRNGSVAQEECLFRCSNLFETVVQDFYPLADDECLYTEDSVFFKDFYYNDMKPIVTDVVTVAAVNLNENSYFDTAQGGWVNVPNDKPANYETLTKQKIRLMLSLASKKGVSDIILGAWGCGVFKNDPTEMATMFKEIIDEGYELNVHFAIINDHNSVANNYELFKNVLG